MTEQDKLKQVIKNSFIYMKDNNLDFSPESYLEAFCKQAKLLNLDSDECEWFNRWSNKFESHIKKELCNHPIKNKDDFINILSSIINTKTSLDDNYCIKILEKALRILKSKNIIDINPKLTLEAIDKKLTDFINGDSNDLFNFVHSSNLLTRNNILLKAHSFNDGYVLICDICCFDSIRDQFGLEALEKLLNAFYRILLNTMDSDVSIGIYGEYSIIILLPNYDIDMARLCSKNIQDAINNSKFVYENRDVDISINIDLLHIKDLKI